MAIKMVPAWAEVMSRVKVDRLCHAQNLAMRVRIAAADMAAPATTILVRTGPEGVPGFAGGGVVTRTGLA